MRKLEGFRKKAEAIWDLDPKRTAKSVAEELGISGSKSSVQIWKTAWRRTPHRRDITQEEIMETVIQAFEDSRKLGPVMEENIQLHNINAALKNERDTLLEDFQKMKERSQRLRLSQQNKEE